MARVTPLLRAFCRWFGPVADSLRGQLNDAEKVKVLVKFVSTYGLSRAALEAAAHDADFLTAWVVPVAPALFAGAWEALSRWHQGAEPPPPVTDHPSLPPS
ncbi:MAG: hypothetical protein P4L84_37280 [Isosphaeraceae bacterium]|nr:hypothetical protein [Isosphaeraceae bacterium]